MSKTTKEVATSAKVEINVKKITSAGNLFKAVSHPLRLKIISFIEKQQETCVNSIYNTLKLEQSITSQHLKTLRSLEVVNARKDGKKVMYSVNVKKFQAINNALEALEA